MSDLSISSLAPQPATAPVLGVSRADRWAAAAVFGTLAVAGILETIDLGRSFSGGPDEGIYMMAGRLLNYGYPFSTFYFDQPSLFPQILALAQRLLGDALVSGRLTVVGFSLIGLALLAMLAWRLGWRIAAPLAVLFAAFNPTFLTQSRIVMAEVPGLAFVLAALLAGLAYRQRVESGSRSLPALLLVSGACFAAGIIVKPILIGFSLTLVWLIVDASVDAQDGRVRIRWASAALDLLVWVLAGLLVTFLIVNPLNLSAEFERTVGFHLKESGYYLPITGDPVQLLAQFFASNWGLLGLALVGLVVSVERAPRLVLPFVLGESASVAILLLLPPFPHHFTILVPVLALLASIGGDVGLRALLRMRDRQPGPGNRLVPALVAAAAFLLLLASIPGVAREDREIVYRIKSSRQQVTDWLARNLQPGAFYITDDPTPVYVAGALIPPSVLNLAYRSTAVIDPDWRSKMDQAWHDYPVQALVTTGEYARNPEMRRWIDENFREIGGNEAEARRLGIWLLVNK